MSSEFYVGECMRFKSKFYDSAGALTDPTAVTCTATTEGVTKVDNAAMTKLSTGIYYYEVTLDVAGMWDLWAKGTSGNLIQKQHDQIVVSPEVPYALCTLQELKVHLGITLTTTTYDDRLLALIDQTTGAIEAFCHRQFALRTYVHERHNGDGGNQVFLNNYPVENLTRFSVDIDDVISVTNSTSDAADAYVSVDENNITLVVVGGTSAGTVTIAKATYTTMAAVVTQIDAQSATGWDAAITSSSYNNFPSTDLLQSFGQRCLNSTVWLTMPGARQSGFRVDRNAGILDYDYNINSGEIQNICVDYVGGYRTTPESLKGIALRLAAYWYNESQHDTSTSSERLGDYAYTLAAKSVTSSGTIIPGSPMGNELGPWVRTTAR